MAQQTAWWLQKNALAPANGGGDQANLERGTIPVHRMLPHHQQALLNEGGPTAPADQAKKEMFGGGRRQRSNSVELPDAPFAISNDRAVKYGRRRSSSHEEVPVAPPPSDDHLFAKLGQKRTPLNPVNESNWRTGDDQPWSMSGAPAPNLERQPVNTSNWRLGEDQPMSVVLQGANPIAGLRARPVAVPSSEWRKPDTTPLGLTPDAPPGRRLQPSAHLDSRWRQYSDAPLQLGHEANGLPPPGGRSGEAGDANRSGWRIGDHRPFRMDGGDAVRHAPSAQLAASEWRLGDANGFTLDGCAPPPRQAPSATRERGHEEARVGVAMRERQLNAHTDSLVKKLAEVPVLEDRAQRVRRGEQFF